MLSIQAVRGVGPLNTARGLGERCKLPSGVWGETPADKRFSAVVAAVFVDFPKKTLQTANHDISNIYK